VLLAIQENFLQEKAVEATKQIEEKRKQPNSSPRNRKACHSLSTDVKIYEMERPPQVSIL
jgi:hypothetical protein